MLAGMLSQVPQKSSIILPTPSLVSAIPQKLLPVDLEKKIVSTPVSRSGQELSIQFDIPRNPGTSNQANCSPRLLRNELTNNIHKENHVGGPPSYQVAESQGFLSNLLMAPTSSGGLPSRPGSQLTNLGPPNTVAPSATNSHVIPVSGIENITASVNFSDFLNSTNITLSEAEVSNKLGSSQTLNFLDDLVVSIGFCLSKMLVSYPHLFF